MTKDELKAFAKEWMAKRGIDKAGFKQEAHCALLVSTIANELNLSGIQLTKEIKQGLHALLCLKGLGGNASQFKQWMFPAAKADEDEDVLGYFDDDGA